MNTIITVLGQASATPAASGNFLTQNPMAIAMVLILVVMYFFMIRPQQKKQKEQQSFKDTLEKGTRVVTIGGLHGKIVTVKDKTFVIEVEGGIKLEFEKTAISVELTKALNNPAPAKK